MHTNDVRNMGLWDRLKFVLGIGGEPRTSGVPTSSKKPTKTPVVKTKKKSHKLQIIQVDGQYIGACPVEGCNHTSNPHKSKAKARVAIDMHSANKHGYRVSGIDTVQDIIAEKYSCNLCKFQGKNNLSLSLHKRKTHGIKGAEAVQRERFAMRFDALVAQNGNTYRCLVCGYKATSRTGINNHLRRHPDELVFGLFTDGTP